MGEHGHKLGKTIFLGIQYTDKNGKEKTFKPTESVKKDVEKYLNKQNNNNK